MTTALDTRSSARDRWLEEGITALREGGIGAVRADRVAQRVALTKGSFHHHFAGMPGYRRALLERLRIQNTAGIAGIRNAVADLEPAAAIQALPALAEKMQDVRLDAAMRGWAVEDAEARATVEQIDAERLNLLTDLWEQVLGDHASARTAALVPHLIAVGASMTTDLRPTDLARVYSLLGTLVPVVCQGVGASETHQSPIPAR